MICLYKLSVHIFIVLLTLSYWHLRNGAYLIGQIKLFYRIISISRKNSKHSWMPFIFGLNWCAICGPSGKSEEQVCINYCAVAYYQYKHRISISCSAHSNNLFTYFKESDTFKVCVSSVPGKYCICWVPKHAPHKTRKVMVPYLWLIFNTTLRLCYDWGF